MLLSSKILQLLLFAAVSGVITGLSLVLPPLWFLVFLGPVPFLYVVIRHENSRKRRESFWLGLFFGSVLNATVTFSAWDALPLYWLGVSDSLMSFGIVGALWLGASISTGFAFALFAYAMARVCEYGPSTPILVLVTGLLWLWAEWLESLFSSLYLLGPVSDINTHVTFAAVGYALGHADSEFWISLARWGGVPALSFFLVAGATCIACILKEASRSSFSIGFSCFAVFIVGSAIAGATAEQARGMTPAWHSTKELTILAVQTNFPPEFVSSTTTIQKRTNVAYRVATIVRDINVRPDLFILPEGTGTRIDYQNYGRISALLPEGALLIHSKYPLNERGFRRVQTRAFRIGETLASITDKQFLMPYGEYLPYHFLAPLRFFAPSIYEAVTKNRLYAGGGTTVLGKTKNIAIGVRICSEIFSAALHRDLAEKHEAGVLVHTSSIGIFHNGSILPAQMRSAARIRAVENGLPIIQAINGGTGLAYDCRGKVITPVLEADQYKVYRVPRTSACNIPS